MLRALLLAITLYVAFPAYALEDTPEGIIAAQVDAQNASANSQKRINQLDDETRVSLETYRALQKEIETLSQDNQLLEQHVGRQKRAIARQSQEIEDTRRLLSQLDDFSNQLQRNLIQLDQQFPFKPKQSPAELITALDSPESTQRFLASLKLWREELNSGSKLTTWDGQLKNDQQVEFVRLGRVALYYLTPDGNDAAMYLSDTADWQPLTLSQIRELIRARDIARNDRKSGWLYLPVPDIALAEGESQ
ncbi:DUF3450 family protein [Parendozoicomonas sp. Alg238-R29]|uniref:DUF3450 family protein n=1 Tax=Parendozoicomonas sp. Alg238-R29 TaxID=2993446 RepID=UPI00248D87CE|nr:DUF3450 family protein [Parendozoicomonas sp. Alg238-R29]